MKKLVLLGVLALSMAPLAGCVVYPARPYAPYAGAAWVPGHYGPNGFWIRGHYT